MPTKCVNRGRRSFRTEVRTYRAEVVAWRDGLEGRFERLEGRFANDRLRNVTARAVPVEVGELLERCLRQAWVVW
jgi:hypothetical protein